MNRACLRAASAGAATFAILALASFHLARAAEPELSPLPVPPQISGAAEAETCEWPTTVLLLNSGALCTGTLIHPEIVSTAAHCLSDTAFPALASFGESAGPGVEREVPIEYCRRNPGYTGGVGDQDYAYCKLATPIYDLPLTPPVYGCETEILTPGREVVIAGFGNNVGMTGSGIKRWATTEIQASSPTVVVVGQFGTASCQGDSGGPVFVQYPDGSWRNLAILSGGPPCEQGAGTYVRLDTAVPWIEEDSGVDVTPCHDVDGTWNPTPACQGFATRPQDTSVAWGQWCASELSEPSETCGPAFNAEPDDVAPVVEIVDPLTGATFDGPEARFDISVEASDEGHGVREVRLEVNGNEVAADAHAPYAFEGAAFPPGGWVLVAVAEDWAGNVTESEPVAIGVDEPAPELPAGGDDGDGGTGFEAGSDLEVGCACGTTGSPAGGPLAAFGLLALLALRVRRR